ncbi:MAG: S41 family peptidase [Bacteroidales bacterium]
MSKISFALVLLFLASNSSGQLENTISDTDKIYGLSKIWKEVNNNFVFIDKIDKELWDKEYRRLISEVQKTENDFEYYRLLSYFVALVNDGHTRVWMPGNYQFDDVFGEFVLMCSYIENKVIVTRVHRDTKNQIPIGTEIKRINGQEVIEYLKENIIPYISSSTDHYRFSKAVTDIFLTMQETTYEFELVLPDETEKNISLTQTDYEVDIFDELYPSYTEHIPFEFYWLEEGIAYMAWNSFEDPAIVSLFREKLPELYKAEKLIIDLRNNRGGNARYGIQMLDYLTNDSILYSVQSRSRMHIPAHKVFGGHLQPKDTIGNKMLRDRYVNYRNDYYDFPYESFNVNPETKKIVVPTAILIGHKTLSAAEDFLVSTDNQSHIIKIGEATGGSTGEPINFVLPGGGWLDICTKHSSYLCGKEYVGYGIQPDIVAKKSVKDVIENVDPALNSAIKYLKQQ